MKLQSRKTFSNPHPVHEQSAVENSFSTYVCYAPDGLFWLNLYTYFAGNSFSNFGTTAGSMLSGNSTLN